MTFLRVAMRWVLVFLAVVRVRANLEVVGVVVATSIEYRFLDTIRPIHHPLTI